MESASKVYLPKLDHLRFLAALMVFYWHAAHRVVPTSYVPEFWPLSLFEEGHTGVSLFMVLSGFIFQTLCDGKDVIYTQFIRNRFLRIFPLFAFWTIFFVYTQDIDPVKLFVSVFALMNKGTVPGVGWTVIVEFQFYLLFPFLLRFFRQFGFKYLLGLVGLSIALRLFLWISTGTTQSLAYWTIFGRIDQFILGMIGYEIYARRYSIVEKFSIPLLVLVAFIFMATWQLFNLRGGYYGTEKSSMWVYVCDIEAIFYAAVVVLYLSAKVRIPQLINKFLAYLGSLSYSLYFNHWFLVSVFYTAYSNMGLADISKFSYIHVLLIDTVCFVFVVLFSVVTYNLIEMPFTKMRRSYLVPLRPEHEKREAKISDSIMAIFR